MSEAIIRLCGMIETLGKTMQGMVQTDRDLIKKIVALETRIGMLERELGRLRLKVWRG